MTSLTLESKGGIPDAKDEGDEGLYGREPARWMPGLGSRRRGRQAAKCRGEVHATEDPRIPEWELLLGLKPEHPVREGNAGK